MWVLGKVAKRGHISSEEVCTVLYITGHPTNLYFKTCPSEQSHICALLSMFHNKEEAILLLTVCQLVSNPNRRTQIEAVWRQGVDNI
jgi:hypothetical protein